MMKIKMLKAAFVGMVLSISSFANSGLITDNGWNTVDVDSGLIFLDLDQLAAGDYATVNNTFSYNGFNWQLATVDQFALLLESVTGTTIGSYTGSTITFIDNSTDLGALATLINGSTAWVDFYLDGGQYGPAQGALHPSWPDGHIYASSGSPAYRGLYVQTSVDVPEPSTLAILALGILSLMSRRFKKQ